MVEYKPRRKRLPKTRPSVTTSFTVGGAEGYLTSGAYSDGQLGEVFLKLGKQGSTLAGVMDAFSIAISIALQYGVPLSTYVEKFTNMKFEPAGMTDDQDIRMAQSLIDYVFRRLALDYLPFEDRSELGIHTAAERRHYVETGSYIDESESELDAEEDAVDGAEASPAAAGTTPPAPTPTTASTSPAAQAPAPQAPAATDSVAPAAGERTDTASARTTTELFEAISGNVVDAPLCLTCGTRMRPSGSCHVCEGCGSTSGCS